MSLACVQKRRTIQAVYESGRQYDKLRSIMEAIVAAWFKIDITTVQQNIDSMRARCARVIPTWEDTMSH